MEVKNVKPFNPIRDMDRVPKGIVSYDVLVESLIRKRYSISAELAILRQRNEKPEEFAEYNAYAEKCKSEAREALGL